MFGLTKSNPPLQNGLHLKILFNPKKNPFIPPYSLIATSIYVEQVGKNLHECGRSGEIANLYIYTTPFSTITSGKKIIFDIFEKIFFIVFVQNFCLFSFQVYFCLCQNIKNLIFKFVKTQLFNSVFCNKNIVFYGHFCNFCAQNLGESALDFVPYHTIANF